MKFPKENILEKSINQYEKEFPIKSKLIAIKIKIKLFFKNLQKQIKHE